MGNLLLRVFVAIVFCLSYSCFPQSTTPQTSQPAAAAKPTVADAEAFMKQAEAQLDDLSVRASRAAWVQQNFIT
ncbi:MAG: hypothetical protein JO187_12360, partial [Acidobacteria bacterium]|nr:hypothetical protein [Acidobacteriota bacterium]